MNKNERDIERSQFLKIIGRANRLAVWSLQRAQDELKAINDAISLNDKEAKDTLENQMGSPNHRSDFPNIKITTCENGKPKALIERDGRYCRRKRAEAASIALLIVAIAIACYAYSSLSEEHPIESISLDYDGGTLYPGDDLVTVEAGVPFTMEAVISPSDATDKTLKWFSSLDGVQLTQNGSHLSILIGPAASTGDILTITARSTAYDKEASLSFKVKNDISLGLHAVSSSVRLGDSVDISCSCSVSGLDTPPIWSVDAKWAILSADGWDAVLRISDSAKKDDIVTVSATIPGTTIASTFKFTVSDGLILSLSADKNVIDVQSSPIFDVNASIQPSISSNTFLKWEVLDTEFNPVGCASFTTSSSDSSTGFNDVITVRVSDNVDDGITLIIRATIQGQGITESVPIRIENEATRSIIISTVDDLLSMEGSVATFVLQNSIDLEGIQWTPFKFDGTLDGNGRTISGLSQTISDRTDTGLYYGGLFLVNNGTIRNLVLDNADVWIAPDNQGHDTTIYAGVVCGINNGNIEDVTIISSSVLAHSTNIKTSWLSAHKTIPAVASGEAKNGSWYDYASLSFTGMKVNDGWGEETRMNVLVGGIAGLNNGSIIGCTVTTDIDAEVINFCTGSSSGTTDVENALVYAGGISGRNTAKIASCTNHGSIEAALILHDSGVGFGAGEGYISTYSPQGNGFIGGLTGYSVNEVTGTSDCSMGKTTEVFAPGYSLLSGSAYNVNKGSSDNIQWFEGPAVGSSG